MAKSNVSYDRNQDLSNKSLLEIYKDFKVNTVAWASWWVLNDTPEDIHPSEHHIITESLSGFRKRYLEAEDTEKEELIDYIRKEYMKKLTNYLLEN